MKPNVDIVDLIAVQELATAVAPVKEDYLGHWKVGEVLGRKITIETVGNIISEQIGSGQVIPDRVYEIGVDMHGATIGNGTDYGFTGTQNVIIDPYLDGKDYSIWIIGFGYAEKGQIWQNDIPGGGIRLVRDGDQFLDGQEYALVFKPAFSSVIVTPDAIARMSSGEQIVTGSVAAGPSYDRKIILVQGATSAAPTYTLNPLYPENVMCIIETGGGSNFQTIVSPPVGQTMVRCGQTITRHILGTQDWSVFVRIGTVWRWVMGGERWKYVGEITYGGVPGPDRISANGQTLQVADYPGVADHLATVTSTYGGGVLASGTWAANAINRRQWGTDGTVINVKDLRGDFLRALDLGAGKDLSRVGFGTANTPGSFQVGQNELHNHLPEDAEDHDSLLQVNGQGTATSTDPGGGDQPNLLSAFAMSSQGGDLYSTEPRPNNVGEPIFIKI